EKTDDGQALMKDASQEAGGPSCAGEGGLLSRFSPSNLPAGFAIPADAKAWVVTQNYCVFDTDTLVGTGCGLGMGVAAIDIALADGRRAVVITADSVTINGGAKLNIKGSRPLIVTAN